MKKVNISQGQFFGGRLRIGFLYLKTLIYGWVRKNAIYLLGMPIHSGFYLRICSRHFLNFSCNIQNISVIITPAFKIQKQSFKDILKKRCTMTHGENP